MKTKLILWYSINVERLNTLPELWMLANMSILYTFFNHNG